MKLKRPLIAAAFILVFSFGRPEASKTIPSNYLPNIQTDFSDLDVRDAQNRPVKTPEMTGELVALFEDNAIDLVLRQTPPALQVLHRALDTFSPLFKEVFFTLSRGIYRPLQAAFLSRTRRVVHNVYNVWITFSDGMRIGDASHTILTLSRKPQKLFLRC